MTMLRAGVTGSVVLLVLASSVMTSADSIRHHGAGARSFEPAALRRPAQLRGPQAASGCDSNYGTAGQFFLGIPSGSGDIVGAQDSGVVAGLVNEACDSTTAIVAGYSNVIGPSGDSGGNSVVGGGESNRIVAKDAFIGAGSSNGTSGEFSFVGAGDANTVSGTDSFIGAGVQNRIDALEAYVGSGASNDITSAGSYAAIGAGSRNLASAPYAVVLGGFDNVASGSYAVAAGGDENSAAGTLSFAGGYHADAVHNGSFVWSDYVSGSALVKDPAADQFVARASGGVYFYTSEGATSGVKLSAGSGTWANLSDRNAKTDIAMLDEDAVLAKLDALPIDTWRYKTETGVRHVGPMAQDFYAAFGVGEDDRHITGIDEDGVALAAIKALHRQNDRLQSKLAIVEDRDLRSQRNLEAKNAALERRLGALEARMAPGN